MTPPPPLRVLTDTDLFQRITSFQYGMPHSLYAFWLEHKPPRDLFLMGFLRNSGVVEKIVERGTLELLVQVKQVRVPYENKWYQLSLVEVVPLAIKHNRPEMLEWGFQNGTWIPPRVRQHSTHHRPESLWRYGVVYFDDGDTRVLDLLKQYVPIQPRSLQTLFSWDFTMEVVKSVELMRWLLTELPQARVERHLMSLAVSRGNVDQVRFLYEHGSRNRCNPSYFRTLYDNRNVVLLTFLVERDLIDVDPYVAIQMVESDEEGVQQIVQRFPSHFVRAFEDVVRRYRYQPDKFRALLDGGYDNAIFKVSIDDFTTHSELETIKMLHERGYATASTDAMDHAAKNRHWAVVDYLHDHSLGGCSAAATDSAAWWGDLEHVKFFHEKYGAGCTSRAMDDAAANGYLDVVRYLHDHTTVGCTSRAMDEAAANGHLDVVRYLHDHTTAECTTRAMDEAAANGHLDIVEYLHTHRSEGCTVAAMNRAAENGHIRVVQFLHTHRPEGCTVAAMNLAAGNGDLRMVKFLHSHRSEGCTKQAMNLAAKYGHASMVEFLHTHRSEGCSVAMDSAAENGHLRVVEFLHTHRSEGCSKRAMDKAAENGHLDVVQFLHTHRSEGCTVAAMNGAAKNDHLAVVEYLRTHRSEGCTAEAVNLYASTETFCSGATIKFLYTHYPQFFGPTNLHDVLLYEHFDVFMQMRTQYPEQAEAVLGKVAFDAGTRFRLPPIRFIVNQLGGANVAHLAMNGAVSTGRLPWIRAVFAVTGPTSCRLSAVHMMRAAVKRQESSATNPAIVFVVNACCEAGAREAMIGGDPVHSDIPKLLRGDTPQLLPLHPFLTDPRAATWAINWVLSAPSWRRWQSAYQRFAGDWSWALMVVDNGDMSMLEMLRDTPASAHPGHEIEGRELDPAVVDHQFSFERARTAAACRGNLPMLQWLIEHVDLPIEPTLLSAALYCHKYETALWLATHYPEACREIDGDIPYAPWFGPCGLEDELLEWLGAHEAVRAQLNLGPIVDVAVSRGDTKSLRTLYAWNPDVVKTRPSFMELASDPDDDMAMFLRELGVIDHA